MSANGSAVPYEASDLSGKGKGKQIEDPRQHDMMADDESESEGEGEESAVEEQQEEPDEDDMEGLDTSNIIYARRTRGKNIDWQDAEQKAKDAGDDLDDEDDDDDEDFQDPDEQQHQPRDEDRMEE